MSRNIQEILGILEGLPDTTERADLMIELAGLYQNSDPCQALAHAERAGELSRNLGYKAGMALSMRIQGSVHEQLGDYPRAVSCGTQALALYREIDNTRESGRCLNNIGLAYTRMGALGVALEFYQRALETLSGNDDDQIRAYVVNNIGLAHRTLDNNQKALEHFQKSLDMLEKLGDRRNAAHALSNIGLCHRTLGDRNLAMEYMRRSLAIRQEIGDRFSQVHSWINIANLHRDLDEHDQSYDCLMRAMDLAVEGGNAIMEVYVMTLLAKLRNLTGQLDSALEYIEQAMPLAEKLGDQGVLRSLYQEIADNHEARGDMPAALEFRGKYFRSQIELLETSTTHIKEGGIEVDEMLKSIKRDQLASLNLKAENTCREFLLMLGHCSSVMEGRKENEQIPPDGPPDDGWVEGVLQALPEASSAGLRKIWSDLKGIRFRVERLSRH